MFERYLTDAVTTYFGNFVENLDSDKVKLSAWKGEVVLNDLLLKRNALEALVPGNCPLEIAYGRIGNLELRIPWKSQLRARNANVECTVFLSDLHILITPKSSRNTTHGDDDDEKQRQDLTVEERRARKEEQVQRLLDAQLFERVAKSSADMPSEESSKSARWQWARHLFTNILSNLSVTVRDIHVRYEDPGNSIGFVWKDAARQARRYKHAFAVGITLRQFSIQTSDDASADSAVPASASNVSKEGSETEEDSKQPCSVTRHKIAAMYQLAVYWDRGCNLMASNVNFLEQDSKVDSDAEGGSAPVVTREQYFAWAFDVLNGQVVPEFVHASLYSEEHTYMLEPVSPFMDFSLVSTDDAIATADDETDTKNVTETRPPSSVNMTFPPCHFTIAPNTLEDTAYLRKTISVWNRTRKSVLSDASLRRLTRLRPRLSVRRDPRAWWKYAMEATLILEGHGRPRRRRGWLGLSVASSRRRKYVKLYERVLCGTDEHERERAHFDLLSLEDELFLDEIVAFRISVYSMISKPSHLIESVKQTTWSEWMRGKQDGSSNDQPGPASVDESEHVPLQDRGERQLTLEHRDRMFIEMAQMLEREKDNNERAALVNGSERPVRPDENPAHVVWTTSMAFKKLSFQVNERKTDHQYHQVYGGKRRRARPVVKISCAAIQEQTIYHDGSWEAGAAVASLEVLDLTGVNATGSSDQPFPVLLGRKSQPLPLDEGDAADDFVTIAGTTYPLSVSISVKRTMERNPEDQDVNQEVATGTTTRTAIRLLPLEMVYSAIPAAALTHAFSKVRTPELSDDYHRMASVVSQWQNRQKRRLLRALAHKKKKIIVDIDVAAPLLVIPEDMNKSDSMLVVVDLGHLKFSNTDECVDDMTDYDDKWKLNVSDVQVQCLSMASYRCLRGGVSTETGSDSQVSTVQELVEPFSLQFIISTKIANEDTTMVDNNATVVHIFATLPRLVFNLTSSAVRHVKRLQLQWIRSTNATHADTAQDTLLRGSIERDVRAITGSPGTGQRESLESPKAQTSTVIERKISFRFSAPMISFRLENDVDGNQTIYSNQSSTQTQTCPLVDLTMRGIRGTFVQMDSADEISRISFDAKLRSVDAVDLYQKAGDDFALLLSSFSPSERPRLLSSFSWHSSKEEEDTVLAPRDDNDLVSVCYESSTTSEADSAPHTVSQNVRLKDAMAISFHQLYVEWNPETIAAIHKAMALPKQPEDLDLHESKIEPQPSSSSSDDERDDEFFDALEPDTDSNGSFISSSMPRGDETDTHLISEVNSRTSTSSEISDALHEDAPGLATSGFPLSPFSYPVRGGAAYGLEDNNASENTRQFEMTFKFSKLRVNFNKESRKRRLVTAEMDGTHIHYLATPSGISRAKATIGNLLFLDPSRDSNLTLYGEILGLKPQQSNKASSLFEMELSFYPKSRTFVSANKVNADTSRVTIDCRDGSATGSDITASIRFSSMRFVYLQQLWSEIVDYFFEAIIGYEVWGNERPVTKANLPGEQQPSSSTFQSHVLRSSLEGARAEEFSFTRFDVTMEDPMILIPVAYRSPQFLRLECTTFIASNYYRGQVEVVGGSFSIDADLQNRERVQWYNNCDMELRGLKMTSWEGTQLTSDSSFETADVNHHEANVKIKLKWPTGALAGTIFPKWRVECEFDPMSISLREEDYALLQHIVLHNIGEPSRHLEEWNALQNLPPAELAMYKKRIMVHFGYDKKDTAPTTYDMIVKFPSLKFILVASNGESVAEASCTSLEWEMKKVLDRVSRQRVSCDIGLVKPGDDRDGGKPEANLLIPVHSLANTMPRRQAAGFAGDRKNERELSYTSTSKPSGDNVKTLEIANVCIFAVYSAWMGFIQFFGDLPAPVLLTPSEVGLSMQVGDRWYMIGGDSFATGSQVETKKKRKLGGDVSAPSYQFRLLLRSPRIILPSSPTDEGEDTNVILYMDHFDFLHHNNAVSCKTTKSFLVHDLEVFTYSHAAHDRNECIEENSLFHPWSAVGDYEYCNGESLEVCEVHSMRVSADVLHARAAYSDMSVAIDVALRLLSDYRQNSSSSRKIENPSPDLNQQKCSDQNGLLSDADRATMHHEREAKCDLPRKSSLAMVLDGFELLIVDDSRRHFANAQPLIELSLSRISLFQEIALHCDGRSGRESAANLSDSSRQETKSRKKNQAKLCLHRIDVFDCLQPVKSPYRLLVTSRKTGNKDCLPAASELEMPSSRIVWLDFRMVEGPWGYAVSPSFAQRVQRNTGLETWDDPRSCATDRRDSDDVVDSDELDLVELHRVAVSGISDDYGLTFRSLTMQWNPSTVIALQRFLGRLSKEMKKKSDKEFVERLDRADSSCEEQQTSAGFSNPVPIRVSFHIERLTMCLNKEHQNRRLVQAALSRGNVTFEQNASGGMSVIGSVGDFGIWDADSYSGRRREEILEENRRILCVSSSRSSAPVDKFPCTKSSSFDDTDTQFLRFRYRTYGDVGPSEHDSIPSWISSSLKISADKQVDIDDYLWISVATLRFNFIRERTEEIIDYLSNGLPGKGMGATSRAAKGFINKRIQTRSFLELCIDAPQIYLPEHETSSRGILVRLGDVNARSWFEEDHSMDLAQQQGWWRILSLTITGLCWSAHEENTAQQLDGAVGVMPVDLNLNLRKPMGSGTVKMSGSLSHIDLTLTYTVYLLLKAVMRDNVGRFIDVARWDNVEKAYWMEEVEVDHGQDGDRQKEAGPAYAADARFIRYGTKRKKKADAAGTLSINEDGFESGAQAFHKTSSTAASIFDCTFELDGLRLTLHRNDRLDHLPESASDDYDIATFNYDMMLLRVDTIEITASANSAGDKSLHLTLLRLGLYDLGDVGRLARERYYHSISQFDGRADGYQESSSHVRSPCAFSVLAEGYIPSENQTSSAQTQSQTRRDPQLVVTIDSCSASSIGAIESSLSPEEDENDRVTVARIVVNFLSFNALIRPLREFVAFLSCSWGGNGLNGPISSPGVTGRSNDVSPVTAAEATVSHNDNLPPNSSRKGFQIKLVAHYPRIFFLADESDPCTRALVLQGLAVLNTSVVNEEILVKPDYADDQVVSGAASGFLDRKVVTAVNAQLHTMETYINPNVESALGLRTHHPDVFDRQRSSPHSHFGGELLDSDKHKLLGVALIEPVTAGVEFCRIKRDRFPTLESYNVNLEPVSTMLSFEDLTLIEVILERWSSKSKKKSSTGNITNRSDVRKIVAPKFVKKTEPDDNSDKTTGRASVDVEDITYDVTFESDRLGLVLKKVPDAVVVKSLQETHHLRPVQAGDTLLAINGANVGNETLRGIVDLLASTPRPVSLTFSRKVAKLHSSPLQSSSKEVHRVVDISSSSGQLAPEEQTLATKSSVDSAAPTTRVDETCVTQTYSVVFRRGVLNGLSVDSSPFGNMPVVTKVLPSFFLDAVLGKGGSEVNAHCVRIPRTGALIAEVDGIPSSRETIGLLHDLTVQPSQGVSDEMEGYKDKIFTVKFVEIDSSKLGTIKAAEICAAGIALTFIDDSKGRDMPLMRGRLENIGVQVEKGFGIDAHAIDTTQLDPDQNGSECLKISALFEAEITCIRASFKAEVDYYHPRSAVWEPLLEPSQLCFLIEWQDEGKLRPGQLAVEASDRVLGDQLGQKKPVPSGDSPVVSVNLTDAAVEVMVRAFREWTEWRQCKLNNPDPDKKSDDAGQRHLEVKTDQESRQSQSTTGLSATASSEMTTFEGNRASGGETRSMHEAKLLAAKKAAQVALVFAQKRGAGTHQKSESSKPFIFRNRTGMSLTFAQQSHQDGNEHQSESIPNNAHTSGKDGKNGKAGTFAPIFLSDGSDARFHMDIVNRDQPADEDKRNMKRVRTYDGRHPSLSVTLEELPGIVVLPLKSLPVFKATCTIRNLEIYMEGYGGVHSSVPVVWTVEIEDNRRILTLSSAVRIVTLGLNMPVDVGISQSTPAAEDTEGASETCEQDGEASSLSSAPITKVGTAEAGSDFYLPLWLALHCEEVVVFVKPSGPGYNWGQQGILVFVATRGPKDAQESGSQRNPNPVSDSVSTWVWREAFETACSVHCEPRTQKECHSKLRPLWLSCISLSNTKRRGDNDSMERTSRHGPPKAIPVPTGVTDGPVGLISVGVDAGLTLRNMLPVSLLWELASLHDHELFQLDGSALREEPSRAENSHIEAHECCLQSGEGADILAFNASFFDVRLRVRFHAGQVWSEWAPVSPSPADDERDDDLYDTTRPRLPLVPPTRQENIQIHDEFGIPLTVGVRIVPKLAGAGRDFQAVGFDVIVFAELWLRNLTSLPLAFGCPSAQVSRRQYRELSDAKTKEAGIINAEAALIEIASVLEFGDKGKGLNLGNEGGSVVNCDTFLLPYQSSDLIFEEIFEYVEVEGSSIKRQWWGSERHDSWRPNPHSIKAVGKNWQWIDDSWIIDCSGQAMQSSGGWESCRSLLGGKDTFFSGRRTYNPNHPFRRRRWFRRRRISDCGIADIQQVTTGQICGGLNAFHQPVVDSFSRAQERARLVQKGKEQSSEGRKRGNGSMRIDKGVVNISIKCSDGQWSTSCVLPENGGVHGIVKVPASRWTTLTKVSGKRSAELPGSFGSEECSEASGVEYASGSLSPQLYELCYKVSDLGTDWGEYTRLFQLSPRFMLRNDSQVFTFEVKQSGAHDENAVVVTPGSAVPFYWADFRLPELACVRPVVDADVGSRRCKWSGGFDVCTLGMRAIRVRRSRMSAPPTRETAELPLPLKSLRSLVEIRPGTGGTGINICFKEEDSDGNGSLFRVENLSPFPIWLAQDGVLANPSAAAAGDRRARVIQGPRNEGMADASQPALRWSDEHAEIDGDLVSPRSRTAFALDVPYRQGKYANRKAASLPELLRVRVGLAPLASRDGIESTKVISFSAVGESIRLNPGKLTSIAGFDVCRHLVDLRVLGVVTTDGPTRVLRFCMMRKDDIGPVFDYPFREPLSSASLYSSRAGYQGDVRVFSDSGNAYRDLDDCFLQRATLNAALEAVETEDIPGEKDATRAAYLGLIEGSCQGTSRESVDADRLDTVRGDTVYSFRASFGGFCCSLIDSVPSEIALITLKDVTVLAKWNKNRTTDASSLISVGWLQVDNYVPNAPFPVAVCPDTTRDEIVENDDEEKPIDASGHDEEATPLLLVGLTFAPKHESGILCLRSGTVAPRDLAVSVDLGFIVRLQQFFLGLREHMRQGRAKERLVDTPKSNMMLVQAEQGHLLPFPDIQQMAEDLEAGFAVGVGSQKLYFEGLNILPCNVNLSVAPARALTTAQASLEGSEAAALHAAVRKGDVLVGSVGSGLLGVKVGHKNQTAAAVVRGVFKSILVDALLRCEAASLNFAGVYVRNQITTGPQLRTYLIAHYLSSLRSNVPTLLGSMAAFGNPLGLIRGLGDGMSDFVTEPVKGLKKSMEELDPSFVVDGVARGTESLARHAVGGFAGSASLLTETFSKNMAVLTLDRRYAQRRDRRNTLRNPDRDITVTFFEGVEHGVAKLVRGVFDGVTGVVKAPLRGAERHGVEGFAKGIGKGLLGLLVKPVIGLSDAATDVMIGVKGSVQGDSSLARGNQCVQVRPRRPMYGPDRIVRPLSLADTAAATLMLRTRLAGENYLSHCDMDDKVALLSDRRALLLGADGKELLVVKFKHIKKVEIQPTAREDGTEEWNVLILLNAPRRDGSELEVIRCKSKEVALDLCSQLNRGVRTVNEN